MAVLQVSVYVENKLGRLREITQVLADAGISIMTHSLEDEKGYGVFRMIVPTPQKVEKMLKTRGFSVRLTKVVAVLVPDVPGGFHQLLEVLAEEKIDFSYTYAIGHTKTGKAVNILYPVEVEKAETLLIKNGFEVLSEEALLQLFK